MFSFSVCELLLFLTAFVVSMPPLLGRAFETVMSARLLLVALAGVAAASSPKQ